MLFAMLQFLLLAHAAMVTFGQNPTVVLLDGPNWIARNSSEKFLKATVPGDIYTDLFANGLLPDPYYRFNDENYAVVALVDWTYSLPFKLYNDTILRENILLQCDGLDTVASVFLNGVLVGSSDNMFRQYLFDIKAVVQSENTLMINFTSAVRYAAEKAKSYPYDVPPDCPPDVQHGVCHPNFIRKAQDSFSWDWGPSFPTQGIWKSISVLAFDGIILSDISVDVIQQDISLWLVNVTGNLLGKADSSLTACMNISIPALLQNSSITLTIDENTQTVNTVLPVADQFVKHWWPNGYGDQILYDLSATLTVQGQVSMQKKRIAFRSVKLNQEPIVGSSGLSFYFKVNGKPIFMKGANWIPADSFQSRVTTERLQDLLVSAKEANMNMLRVWGGGIYEQDVFYDLADEMGLLIWQDMMFACALYPVNNDFLTTVQQEVGYQVRRLKHHPSLAIWAGNNENEAALRDNWYNTKDNFTLYKDDYVKLYIDTIKQVVLREHPTALFVSSSPSNGVESEKEGWVALDPYDTHFGDVHYYNYSPGRWYNDDFPRSRFMSEYGLMSWPSFNSLKSVTVSDDWHEFSDFAIYRNHHGNGQQQMNAQLNYYFNAPNASLDPATNFSHYIYLTQINQAMYVRMVSEFNRRSQSYLYEGEGFTMGSMYWMLNDIWQAPTWSSIEYGGKWKMLHYYAKKFFATNALSMAIEKGNLTVYVIQDLLPYLKTSPVTISCYAWNSFKPISSINATYYWTDEYGGVSFRVFNQNLTSTLRLLNCEDTRRYFLNAAWSTDTYTLSTELFLSDFRTAIGLSKPVIKVEVSPTPDTYILTIRVLTDGVAPFVWLDSPYSGHFSDNGFLLLTPNMTLTFQSTDCSIESSAFQNTLSVTTLMDVYSL